MVTDLQPRLIDLATAAVPKILAETDVAPRPDALVDPEQLIGVAGDGRPIDTLFATAVTVARAKSKTVMLAGDEALEMGAAAAGWRSGRIDLATKLLTVTSDTARVAAGLNTVTRPRTGYIRKLVGASCSRCVVLAGRTYGSADAFDRHPRCDCEHVPASTRNLDLRRVAIFKRETVNEDARTVAVAFSSEEPVERWFGIEILDHSPKSVDLSRLKDGGPGLVDHDPRDHVATVEEVSIDGDRVGRATLRFGRGARADEIFQDVVDGIRKCISVGYRIHKVEVEDPEAKNPTYRATLWEPYEISFVSIPADTSVGVGRSEETIPPAAPVVQPAPEPSTRKAPMSGEVATQTQEEIRTIEQRGAKSALERVQAIIALGEQYAKHGGK